jgi:hypothetical protein
MIPENMEISAASFRDPAGYVFIDKGIIKRAVTIHGEADYQRCLQSGLYDRLIKDELLVSHREESPDPSFSPAVKTILVPEQIRTLSYPYEWGFGQLRDAALLTLKVERIALEFGMSLKDASAFNIQFIGPKPIFIDTLSFEQNDGGPWPAYNQFCRHFLAPLSLMSYIHPGFNLFWKSSLDGFPLDLTSTLLPRRTYLKFGLLIHMHLHAKSQIKHSKPGGTPQDATKKIASKHDRKQVLIDSLRSTVAGLHLSKQQTEWADYYKQASHYSDAAEKHKKEIVGRFLKQLQPQLVYDLGGNIGEYSRLATAQGASCVCFDIDPLCVHYNYERARTEGDRHMLPLMMDLTNPTPPLGFHLRERLSFFERPKADLLLVLALIHHLRITGNTPFRRIAAFLADLSGNLLLEYVPKHDSMVRALLSSRRDTFFDYDEDQFVAAFNQYFVVKERVLIPETDRSIYLFQKRTTDVCS